MKVFWNKDLLACERSFPFDFVQGQDFGSGVERPLNAST